VDRRAFGPCRTRKGRELRRRVTAGDAALEPPDEALNRLADAAPGAAEPFPPDRNDPPFRSDGKIVPRPADAEVGAVAEVVGPAFVTVVVTFGSVVPTDPVVVTLGTVVPPGSVVVTFGTVVVTFGTVVLIGRVVVTFGTVVVTLGTVVLIGRVVVTFGTVVVTLGTVVLIGSVVVTFGSVVLTGSVVLIVGSTVVIRFSAADCPGTAVLATKPKRNSEVRAAARFTALEYPD
jgi:hypothetical protein